MKRPVTSLCRRPGKKTACGQSVPGAGTIFAHRDALRRAVRSAGQKLPGRGRKNSPRRKPGAVRRLRPRGNGRQWGCLVPGKHRTGHPPGQRARPGTKTAPAEAGNCAQAAPMGERRASCVGWCLESTALGARRGRGHARAQKQPPAGPEAVWMRDMGVTTCPGRSV